jgi:hypothetical protein
MLGPTDERRIRTSAKALRTGSPPERDPDCQRAPQGTRAHEPTPATHHASSRPASPQARTAAHRPPPAPASHVALDTAVPRARADQRAAAFASYGGGLVKCAGVSAPAVAVVVGGWMWSGVSGRRGVWVGATLGQPHMRDRGGSQDLGSSQRPLSGIERRHLGGWLTGESADVRVCAVPGPPRRLDAPDGCVVGSRGWWRSPSRRRRVRGRSRWSRSRPACRGRCAAGSSGR